MFLSSQLLIPGTMLLRELRCSGATNSTTNSSPGRKRKTIGGNFAYRMLHICLPPATRTAALYISHNLLACVLGFCLNGLVSIFCCAASSVFALASSNMALVLLCTMVRVKRRVATETTVIWWGNRSGTAPLSTRCTAGMVTLLEWKVKHGFSNRFCTKQRNHAVFKQNIMKT